EYGEEADHRPRERNRQRKNWPDSALSSSRYRPPITTLTTSGPSWCTAATYIWWRRAWRSGVTNRYQTMAPATPAYSDPQTTRAPRLSMNSAPVANWWLKASATARYV